MSAWRIDTIASDYKSDVFVINGTRVFDIGFSAPKESATQSLPLFDKMLNSFQFTVTTPNVTANEDTRSTTDITNASVTNNQSTIPLNEIVQQKPLSQLSPSLIPLPSQQQEPSTFQTEQQQQQPLPSPSNISQQQQQQQQQQQPLPPPSQQQQQQQQQQPLPPQSNISQQLQLHLDEAIKALQAGDTAGAKVHMTEADKVIQEGAAKMHLDEAIKALESGDTAGAETHAQMAQDSQQQQQQPLPPPSNISQDAAATTTTTTSWPGYAAATTNLSAATISSTTAAVVYLSAAYSTGSTDHSAATRTAIDADYSPNSVIAPE